VRVEETVTVRCRPSAVWDAVSDPAQYTQLVHGVTRWDELRAGDPGHLGARYAMRMRVGSVEVGGEVEIVEYTPGRDIAWTGITGITQRGRWRVREVDPGVTAVTLRIAYQSPGGLTGLIVDGVSSRQVRGNLRTTLATLRERCEESGGGRNASVNPVAFGLQQLRALEVLARAGVLRPSRPDRIITAALALHQWGLTVPGGYAAAAALHPTDTAIVDEAGSVTFADIEARSNALANGLSATGIVEGDRVGILCRNHSWFVEAAVALGKLGADVVLLNNGFAAPQLADVLHGEDVNAVVHDEEFASLLGDAVPKGRRFVAWRSNGRAKGTPIERLIRQSDAREPRTPERVGRITLLTSGTTGTPRGATRPQPRTADPLVAILSRIPMRARETTLVAAPLFHAWGTAHLGLGMLLSSTLVLQRQFDPEATLAAIDEHRATALIAVPLMLQRILALPARTRRRYDTSSLRVVAVSGSALSEDLARRFMDAYGDILYNLYGSTEVAWATIATPEDLRSAPGTVGRPPRGTVVKLLDDTGDEVEAGQSGRIFVGNEMLFEGYTGGGSKDVVDGLMATGDVGHFDDDGRLFVDGRDDEMIVSGGENVFPAEVEELLAAHRDVVEAAVVGVPDPEWGQRLEAHVVRRPGARLSEDAVRDYVRAHLARYKVPRDVAFVDALPRNATGKVLKRDLESVHANGEHPKPSARPRKKAAAARRHRV
jgi:acyl-CoA synthetase (AMP-forming)/AMP-acid ligase II